MAKKAKNKTNQAADEPRREPVESKTEVRRVEAEESGANPMIRNIIIVVLIIIGLYFLINLISNRDDSGDKDNSTDETSQFEGADDNSDSSKTENNQTATEPEPSNLPADTTVEETADTLNYTVGAGESYTTVARRAIASLGGDMTNAERVAAETKLTTDADAGLLNIGQDVHMSKEAVKSAVDWAKSLSSEQKAAWQPYADLVAW